MTLKDYLGKRAIEKPDSYVATRQLKPKNPWCESQRALDELIHQKCRENDRDIAPTYEIMHHKCGAVTQKVKDREIDR